MSYRPPSLEEFAQLRRGLPVLAALLFVAALVFPMWSINVHAVQYPNEVLHLDLYAYPRISGDYVEMARLNKYIGFYYPDPVYWQPNFEVHQAAVDVPEWSLGPLAFVAVAAGGAFVAIAPTIKKLKRGLTYQLLGTITVFTVMVADIQYRLYQTGHNLDPEAPVIGVDPFTPPLVGKYEVANITSFSSLGIGAYMSIVAIGLLVVAFYYRDTDATFSTAAGSIRRRLGSIRTASPSDRAEKDDGTSVKPKQG
ncbi:hypothetical protein [Haloferax sp. DFSO52]|uniref:hypothetical protein n=1 Tax=Haloferax sp. DFSO52 TaxID=3388505 RepID=UPI003A84DEDA